MAIRENLQDRIVTAKKYYSFEGDTLSAKQKLSSVLVSYNEVQNALSQRELETLTSDGVLTPDEKLKLKDRWDYLSSSYLKLVSALEEYGIKDIEELDRLEILYSSLYVQMQAIFADMETTSKVPADLENNLTNFSDTFNSLSGILTTYLYGVQAFSVRIETVNTVVDKDTPITLTITIYKDGKEYLDSSVIDMYRNVKLVSTGLKRKEGDSGTLDPAYSYKTTPRTLVIPYNSYEHSFDIYAFIELSTTDL